MLLCNIPAAHVAHTVRMEIMTMYSEKQKSINRFCGKNKVFVTAEVLVVRACVHMCGNHCTLQVLKLKR
jgi:hypothetical protein